MAKSASLSYKLSCELKGHDDEVKSLAVFKDGNIVSTSKDKTSRLWKVKDGRYKESIVMKGHDDWVCSVCVIEATKKNPTGFIVTGSNDKTICIYCPGKEEPTHKINGHEKTVCDLKASVVDRDVFLSSSADGTGKLWNLNDLEKPKITYKGHNNTADSTIWCITDLLNGNVATGGSDKTVMVYNRNGNIIHKLTGHSGSIRGISAVNDHQFLTCGSDAVTKHWNAATGTCLGTYTGHTSNIYSITTTFGGSLAVSCGEDKTMRIWRDGQMDQTIAIPATVVWNVKILPNEDIACASSDGIIRIFTIDASKYINEMAMKMFEETVLKDIQNYNKENQKKKKKKKEESFVPRAPELNTPGEKDGDTVIVRDANGVKAYRWSESQFLWSLIGDVVQNEAAAAAGASTSGKPKYKGVEYDYVFSVDIEEGAPHLKLPYNRGQDPYIAALQFLEDNELDHRHLEKVVNFIIANLQLTPILNAESQFQNQFSSGSRYVSNTYSRESTRSASRSLTPPTSLDLQSYIPQTSYLKLEQANISAIRDKLKEFNEKGKSGTQILTADQLDSLIKLISDEGCGDGRSIDEEISNLKSLLNWPDDLVFPVLDIARLAVLKSQVNEKFCTNGIMDVLKRHIDIDAVIPNQMLTFRLLANLFSHQAGEEFCMRCKDQVLTAIRGLAVFGNKNNEVAMSTYILNLVVALNKVNDTLGKIQALNVIFRLLENLKETEAVFRLLVALGTLILAASNAAERNGFIKTVKQSRPVLKALRILLDGVDTSNVPSKLLSVTKQILELIKQ